MKIIAITLLDNDHSSVPSTDSWLSLQIKLAPVTINSILKSTGAGSRHMQHHSSHSLVPSALFL